MRERTGKVSVEVKPGAAPRLPSRWKAVLTTLCLAMPIAVHAQNSAAPSAERGARLFASTAAVTGKQVGACIACHANQQALREMLLNRGAKPQDARAVQRLLQRAIDGVQPGAAGAKHQYRGVLSAKDLQDLAAYIAAAARS